MNPRFLLDTHIAVWWLALAKNLSRAQVRVLEESVRRHERVGISAMSLIEIAVLAGLTRTKADIDVNRILGEIDSNPVFEVLPITVAVADEVLAIGDFLRDPFDRTIVCTARVHKLRLLTSDQRIIDSKLVPVID